MSKRPIAVSVGDAAGVGPLVALRAACELRAQERFVLFGDAGQIQRLAQQDGTTHLLCDLSIGDADTLEPGRVGVVDTGPIDRALIGQHRASAELGEAQWRTLHVAACAVRDGHFRALTTGPTSKAAIVSAGHAFTGQTELLAALAGLADDDVTMMFLGPRLRVALVTTHLAVADVPAAVTTLRVMRSVRHLAQALLVLAPSVHGQRLVVAGLNPHAGEGGLFGREEIEAVTPALRLLASEAPFADGKMQLSGPDPAESVFRAAQRGDIQGVVAMLHDQATIASKLLDWGSAVNVTWGLPFVRTSVDHGVAYDAARTGKADHDGMLAALQMAHRLTEPRHD